MKLKKFLAVAAVCAVAASQMTVFAANTPETVKTKAEIEINKVLESSDGVFPNTTEFNFNLKPVSYTLASTGTTVADTTATYMPAGENRITVTTTTVSENGQSKSGKATKELDFTGKDIGVYTYELTEVDGGATGVTYDKSKYYVNVYVINQVDENKVPTGNVTVANITAWKTDNMSSEALKALTEDTVSAPNPATESGKMAVSNDGKISYPFTNKYNTDADIKLEKVVTGNYANKNQLFSYTVTVNGATNAEYAITYTGSNEGTKPAKIKSGEATTIQLKHGDKFDIKDLPANTTYTIVESQDATYSAKALVKGDANGDKNTEYTLGQNATLTGTLSDNKMSNNILADEEITVTNNKEYTTPTGVMLNVLPFVCGIVVVGAAFVIVTKKRQED